MSAEEKPNEKPEQENDKGSGRRNFLQSAAAGLIGAAALGQAFAQSGAAGNGPIGGETREQLRQDMLTGIEDDIKKDLDMRSKADEELPRPKNLRPGAMLDAWRRRT